jgi:hypothetical protein
VKPLSTILTIALALAGLRDGYSQGFINLNFEAAQIIPDPDSPYYPYGISATNALPGWTVYYGANPKTQITYNAPAVGSTWVSIYATNGSQIAGNYSVLLQGGFYPFQPPTATISQTGLVPASALSLLFEAYPGPGALGSSGPLQVSLGGQALNYFALSTGANYTLYEADISAFAGQTATLSFSALQDLTFYNGWTIDNIQFSPLAVPEPGELALAALGTLLLGCRRWGQGRR